MRQYRTYTECFCSEANHAELNSGFGPTTEAYLLIGDNERLRTLVGRRARDVGEADPAQVAEIRELTPMVRASAETTEVIGTAGDNDEPRVRTAQEIRLEVARPAWAQPALRRNERTHGPLIQRVSYTHSGESQNFLTRETGRVNAHPNGKAWTNQPTKDARY